MAVSQRASEIVIEIEEKDVNEPEILRLKELGYELRAVKTMSDEQREQNRLKRQNAVKFNTIEDLKGLVRAYIAAGGKPEGLRGGAYGFIKALKEQFEGLKLGSSDTKNADKYLDVVRLLINKGNVNAILGSNAGDNPETETAGTRRILDAIVRLVLAKDIKDRDKALDNFDELLTDDEIKARIKLGFEREAALKKQSAAIADVSASKTQFKEKFNGLLNNFGIAICLPYAINTSKIGEHEFAGRVTSDYTLQENGVIDNDDITLASGSTLAAGTELLADGRDLTPLKGFTFNITDDKGKVTSVGEFRDGKYFITRTFSNVKKGKIKERALGLGDPQYCIKEKGVSYLYDEERNVFARAEEDKDLIGTLKFVENGDVLPGNYYIKNGVWTVCDDIPSDKQIEITPAPTISGKIKITEETELEQEFKLRNGDVVSAGTKIKAGSKSATKTEYSIIGAVLQECFEKGINPKAKEIEQSGCTKLIFGGFKDEDDINELEEKEEQAKKLIEQLQRNRSQESSALTDSDMARIKNCGLGLTPLDLLPEALMQQLGEFLGKAFAHFANNADSLNNSSKNTFQSLIGTVAVIGSERADFFESFVSSARKELSEAKDELKSLQTEFAAAHSGVDAAFKAMQESSAMSHNLTKKFNTPAQR